MRRNGAPNAIAAGLLVVAVLIGLTGYYVATTYQTKIVTQTETATVKLATTATQTVLVTTNSISLTTSTHPWVPDDEAPSGGTVSGHAWVRFQ